MIQILRLTTWFCFLLHICIFAESYRLPLKVNTGFFERDNALVKTEIDFKKSIDPDSVQLLQDNEKIPWAFVPSELYKGTLYWILEGEIPSLTEKEFMLTFADGTWSASPFGDEAIIEKAKSQSNIVPNAGFEIIAEGQKKANWAGEKVPDGWDIRDFPWRHKDLADVTSTCRISNKEVHQGQTSLEFTSELRKDVKDEHGNPVNLIGYAISPVFSLKPDTEYAFSYFVKFTTTIDNGRNSQAISASVNFLDEKGERIYPRNYAVNRLQAAFVLTRQPSDNYAGKWVQVEARKRTPPEVRFGQVWISGSFTGQAYVDDLVLREITRADSPVEVEQGTIEKLPATK